MSSVKLVLKRDKAKDFTKIPLYLRITKDGRSSYKSLSIKVSEHYWNEVTQRVTPKHPNSTRVNAKLSQEVSAAEKALLQAEDAPQYETAQDIMRRLNRPENLSFTAYARKHCDELKEDNFSRYKKVNGVLNKLQEHVGRDILFKELTPNLIRRFETWMKEERGNSINTIHSNLKTIRQYILMAIKEGLIEPESNPFLSVKLKTEKTQREFLTEEEVNQMWNIELNETYKVCRDMFVLACETGLRISDLLTVRKTAFTGTHLKFQMRKTKETLRIKLSSRAKEIVLKYLKGCESASDFICPALRGNSYSKPQLDKAIMSKTALYNQHLKIIAERADIEKHISFHVSRHTFGTRALQKGIAVQKVQKLMGHSDIKTTMVYAKVVNSELDEAMDAFG